MTGYISLAISGLLLWGFAESAMGALRGRRDRSINIASVRIRILRSTEHFCWLCRSRERLHFVRLTSVPDLVITQRSYP